MSFAGRQQPGQILKQSLLRRFSLRIMNMRVRTQVQGEEENFRDFTYMYKSLCQRWKPDISKEEVIKLILKNSNPKLTSQLRSSKMNTVDGLVRLGKQLEQDRDNQSKDYKQCHGKPTAPVDTPAPSKPPGLFCWCCKGAHAPAYMSVHW